MNSSPLVRSYRLRLANEQEWRIIGVNRMARLAEKLASIMGLKASTSDGVPRLILKQWEVGERVDWYPTCVTTRNIVADITSQGWRPQYPTVLRVLLHDEVPDVIFEIKELTDRLNNLSADVREMMKDFIEMGIIRQVVQTIYHQVQDSGGLPFHSGFATWKRKGVLLAGHHDIGKSTCCRRLPSGWRALSDDRVLVVRTGLGQYVGHPVPTWSNFLVKKEPLSWNVEQYVPLAAVLFLEQAETDEIILLDERETIVRIADSATQVWQAYTETYHSLSIDEKWPPRRRIFDNACEMAKSIPAFILRVNLTGRFWEKIEKVLSEIPKTVKAGEMSAG